MIGRPFNAFRRGGKPAEVPLKRNRFSFNYIFIGLSLVVLFIYVFMVDDLSAIGRSIREIKPLWLVLSALCIALYWLCECWVLHVMTKKQHPSLRFADTFRITMIGQFFNCVTPSASGGQPMQAYYLVRLGVPLSVATAGLIARFIVYQSMLVLTCTAALLFRLSYFVSRISGFILVALIGFLMNLIVIAFFFGVAYFEEATKRSVRLLARALVKLRLIKKASRDTILDRLDREVKSFSESFNSMMRGERNLLLKSCGMSFAQILFYLLIPYCIYIGFGFPFSWGEFLTMLTATAFVSMTSSLVPLPGSSIAAEGSFFMFFGLFFPAGALSIAMLIWRLVSFYVPLFTGSLFTLRAGALRAYEPGDDIT